MDEAYIPISCSMHDKLLAHATKRQPCELVVEGDDAEKEPRLVAGLIVDVFSRDGAEYLRLRDGDLIRLDKLVTVDGEEVLPA